MRGDRALALKLAVVVACVALFVLLGRESWSQARIQLVTTLSRIYNPTGSLNLDIDVDRSANDGTEAFLTTGGDLSLAGALRIGAFSGGPRLKRDIASGKTFYDVDGDGNYEPTDGDCYLLNECGPQRMLSADWRANALSSDNFTAGTHHLWSFQDPSEASSDPIAYSNTESYRITRIATFSAGQTALPKSFACYLLHLGSGAGTCNFHLEVREDGNDTTAETVATVAFAPLTANQLIKDTSTFATITSVAPYFLMVRLSDGGSCNPGSSARAYCTAAWQVK